MTRTCGSRLGGRAYDTVGICQHLRSTPGGLRVLHRDPLPPFNPTTQQRKPNFLSRRFLVFLSTLFSLSRTLHVFKLPIQLTYFPSRAYACIERRQHICYHKDTNAGRLSQTNRELKQLRRRRQRQRERH